MAGEKTISDALVLRKKIAIGTNGTFIFDGTYEGHPASVKRFVKGFHDFAEREHRMLLASVHSNVIRLYGRQEDDDFIYLALEPCDCTLSEFVKIEKHRELWSYPHGFPTPELLMLIRGIVAGLAHLHSVGFVLPDLKPSDVLMVGLLPKLSCSYILLAKNESLSAYDISNDETKAIDMFNLGLVIYFCLAQGKHLHSSPTEFHYEAWDLIFKLRGGLETRPTAPEVLLHPLFWNSEKWLSFMKDAGVWVENTINASLLPLLEEISIAWQHKTRDDFLDEMERTKNYNYNTVRGILCIVRDTVSDYHTLPPKFQELLGVYPEGVDLYFRLGYPKLVTDLYDFMRIHCKHEEWFGTYMKIV